MLRLFAALVIFLSLGGQTMADQNDPRLDELFARLLGTVNPEEAREIEFVIWNIWMEADDPLTQRLLDSGTEAMSRRDYDKALVDFNTIVERAPDFAEGWNKSATLYYLMGRYKESITDIERTLALEPRHFGALSGLGLVQLALENEPGALEAFERALAVNPHMPGPRRHYRELSEKLRGFQT